MSAHTVAKITISLPTTLLEVADRLAKERATSRSGLIAYLLKKEEGLGVEALMEEGYRAMAEESRRLADQALPALSDLIGRMTRWDEPADG